MTTDTYSIKFNNTCSRVWCPDCDGVHKPAVGLQVVKGNDFDIVCHECAVQHAPELTHAFAVMGRERFRDNGWHGWVDKDGEIGSTIESSGGESENARSELPSPSVIEAGSTEIEYRFAKECIGIAAVELSRAYAEFVLDRNGF